MEECSSVAITDRNLAGSGNVNVTGPGDLNNPGHVDGNITGADIDEHVDPNSYIHGNVTIELPSVLPGSLRAAASAGPELPGSAVCVETDQGYLHRS